MEIQQNLRKNDIQYSKKNKSQLNNRRKLGNIKPEQASRMAGISWVVMFFLSIPTVLLVLEQLVIKGDTVTSLSNIRGNEWLLYTAIASYFVILTLDTTIAIGLYSVLKYTEKRSAMMMTILRILFVIATAIGLIGLGLLKIEFYSTMVLIGYLFLIPHLFLLGYLTSKSWYLSKALGLFMIIGSFSFVITIYGKYLFTTGLYDILYPLAMIPASLAEISLGIYLILKSKVIDERIDY